MRVALAHSHPNTFGGGERAVLELTRGLSEQHSVRLLVGDYRPDRTYPELASYPRRELGTLDWLTQRTADDVVIANSFGSNLLSLRNPGRVVYWVHSVRSTFLASQSPRPDLLLRRAMDWLAVRRSARLVANSHFTATQIQRLYGRKADAVIHPGVDVETFTPGGHAATSSSAVTVSRLSPEKGLDRLLAIWRELPDVPLTLVGDGDASYVEHLHHIAPANVRFAGALDTPAVLAAYRAASLAVFAPHDEELGLAPLEAMACGLPVVAWAEGGLLETVADGESGYLVTSTDQFANRVRVLAESGSLRDQFGTAGRARAASFTWAEAVSQMDALLEGLR